MLELIQIPVLKDNYIYLVHDSDSGETAVIDPAEAEPVLSILEKNDWELTYILNTHHHSDHVGGNEKLKQRTGCTVIGSTIDQHRIPSIDRTVVDEDSVTLGQYVAKVIATPGHTLGHIVYFFPSEEWLFTGDTLFLMGCGRLFEGTAEQMWYSLQKLKTLPESTKIYCAHEYTLNNANFALTLEPLNRQLQERLERVSQSRKRLQSTVPATLKEELETNPFFREDSICIRNIIGMPDALPMAVFSELRRLKDLF